MTYTTCFVCAYQQRLTSDQQYTGCHTRKLSGQILSANEYTRNGVLTPAITLSLQTGGVATIYLKHEYYHNFVQALIMSGKEKRKLSLSVYHLPNAPLVTETRGYQHYHYDADEYTLAVLEPDTLLNITDLSQADYCQRGYALNELVSSPPSFHTILGNIVHDCFTSMLKEGQTSSNGNTEEKEPLETLVERFEKALEHNTLSMALANVSAETLREEVLPHFEHLANWYEARRTTLWGNTNSVRAETTLFAPEIGLRGRLDLYWQQSATQSLLELKTGGASGQLPKSGHRKQVNGYQSLLLVRHNLKFNKATTRVVYSAAPGQANDVGIPFEIRNIQRTNETRNLLVLSRITGKAPLPPGGAKCSKCSMQVSCMRVSHLLDWQQPAIESGSATEDNSSLTGGMASHLSIYQQAAEREQEQRAFFQKYYTLLQMEGEANQEGLKSLWTQNVEERVGAGKTIANLLPLHEPRASKDGWEQEFRCDNQSELREGDEILLSDGDPITGNVVTGTIVAIGANAITVWTREPIDNPSLIDKYDNDRVHVRTKKNLLRWLDTSPRLQDLVAGRTAPRFLTIPVEARRDFNAEQNEAVAQAMRMQDYLLIQGPPGTGKTSVIAEITRRLVARGERVLLAAFTNQAADNMLERLQREGVGDFIRLGHERSVDKEIEPRLLKCMFETLRQSKPDVTVHDVLRSAPIVASTTATWASDEYVAASENDTSTSSLAFDVAIIDEASQLTVPALLGALRFAKRFILVGDDKQLPPLVMSEEAANKGLAQSLFAQLKQHVEEREGDSTTSASVMLTTQYRMHQVISHFSSVVFYDRKLVAHESNARRLLTLKEPVSLRHQGMDMTRGIGVVEQAQACVQQAIDPRSPLVFLDVQGKVDSSSPKLSPVEVLATCEVVQALLKRGVQAKDIGVIAPYRAQVASIRRLLMQHASQGNEADIPLVSTVDRFQGSEREVIIISFATTHAPTATEKLHEFLTDGHRLNVALTRAKSKLILIGHKPALEQLPIFSRLLTYCGHRKTIYPYYA